MYELTSSEAATVLAILSRGGLGETADIGPAGIPASTYYATRRRMYEAGWLSDRFVPNPWALDVASIDFVLVHPGPTERTRLEQEWAGDDENVLLWSGLNLLLGVFFRGKPVPTRSENGTALSITADSGSVPVYFDFARPWSRFVGADRESGYPRAVGSALGSGERAPRAAVRGLLDLDDHDGGASGTHHPWHSTTGLSRGQQRLLQHRILESRTFLNLDALPPYRGRELGEIVFISGRLREGVSATDVFGALNNECRVSPLLLAEDGARILILALGQVDASTSNRTRVPRATRSVSATLDEALRDVRMTVEHTRSVRRLVDHRYARLVAARRT